MTSANPWPSPIRPVKIRTQPHGVYSILIPAERAQMTVDGVVAPGRVWPRLLGSAEITTCCLALSETWTIPRDHPWANE